MTPISAENIVMNYGKVKALDAVSLKVEKGELFGLIGPDGAGKTSLIKILGTLLLANSGTAEIEGMDVVKQYQNIRRQIGYMPGKFSLYQDLTVEENLNFYASIFGTTLEENYDLIKDIYKQIEPFKKRRAGKLSGGMKQKLALSCALIHKPKVLFLDEPTRGVDPVSRQDLWDMLQSLKKDNITILVSTAYMEEALLCDRISLMDHGKILATNSPDGLIANFEKPLYAIRSGNSFKVIKKLKDYEHANSVYPFGDWVHYTDKRDTIDPLEIKSYLENNDTTNVEIKQIKASVEDCYMSLTSKNQNYEPA
ncbi:ABC transporter ATP-binding protein [Zobellia barbeyronii]|uniref:ABC transporter ATP-binding protein n=1 Tax=Zobellia barbeyronii TaxID=2748009 RepID=A0ABS5WEQ4_9FLAO|nr:ABC transporter ATP-binding protein [Zobellia barbeyronii]MBT2161585.1 ABC transporter ATP-binding protein [Zobellia barbeyronii]